MAQECSLGLSLNTHGSVWSTVNSSKEVGETRAGGFGSMVLQQAMYHSPTELGAVAATCWQPTPLALAWPVHSHYPGRKTQQQQPMQHGPVSDSSSMGWGGDRQPLVHSTSGNLVTVVPAVAAHLLVGAKDTGTTWGLLPTLLVSRSLRQGPML